MVSCHKSAVTSLNFHPLHPLLLSSGPASTLFLHHISPHPSNPNPLLTSLHLRSTPLSTSAFLPPHGSKIFFAGRRRHFHTWDLSSGKVEKVSSVYGHANEQRTMENFKLSPCGRWMGLVGSGRKGGGMVNVLDARTCQWVAEVHVEGRNGVADFAWWGDGEGMLVLGKGGEAVEWDRREKRVIACWVDDGAIGTAVVALGGHVDAADSLGPDRWLAVGSSSGIVNVYDRKAWSRAQDRLPRAPKPTRAFDHLTTTITNLAFSPDGQLLVLASRFKRDALRLGTFSFSFLPYSPLPLPSPSPLLPQYPPIPYFAEKKNSPSPYMHRLQELADFHDAAGPRVRARVRAARPHARCC